MSAGRVLLGAVIGMAAGAVLGVLFAPEKGATTRKKLSQRGSRYIGDLKNTTSDYVDTLEENFASARETAVGLTDRVKGAVDSLAGEPHKSTRRT